MENLGGIENATEEREKNEIVSITEEKSRRKRFCCWTVGGREYRLKLKASAINRLENKYRKNMMNVLLDDGMPPLSVMLTTIQTAMEPWEHGVSYSDVEKLYDRWEEKEDGNQTELFTDIIVPLMTVSGFFTPKQAQEILESVQKK